MKKRALIIPLAAIPFLLFAFLKPAGKTYNPGICVSAEKFNLLYINIKNPVRIAVPGYKASDLEIRTNGDSVLIPDSSEGLYYIIPQPSVRELTLSVYSKSKGILLGNKEFRVRRLPRPEVFFYTNSGHFAHNRVLLQGVSAALPESFPFEGLEFKVLHYKLEITNKAGHTDIYSVQGSAIPNDIITVLNNTKPGDTVQPVEVAIQGPAGTFIMDGEKITI